MSNDRTLTEAEQRVLNMIISWEKLIEQKASFGILNLSPDAFRTVLQVNIVTPVKTELVVPPKGSKVDPYYKVILDMKDFCNYIATCCRGVGFVIELDGRIKTQDDLYVTKDFII